MYSAETDVYAGRAVVAPFAQNRPREFGNVMGEMLFRIGEDNLLIGPDYALWTFDSSLLTITFEYRY